MTGLPRLGERLPSCVGMTADFRPFSFETQAGRPALIILAHDAPVDALGDGAGPMAAAFAARGADILLLGTEDVVRAAPAGPGWIAVDCGAEFLAGLGVASGAVAVLVADRCLRVARAPVVLAGLWPDGLLAEFLAAVTMLPVEPARVARAPAPVLVLPNLLSGAMCAALVARIDGGDTIDGQIAGIGADGAPVSRVDHARKFRRDLLLPEGDPLQRSLRGDLLAACAPEIARAFQARITHTDRILLARYDAGAGWFSRHRDTNAANIAFREFALSVCLDAEGFEGGEVLFAEYNDHRHAVPTGAGLIFSAALLHEVAPVTAGARHVLLTFLHGAAAEERRLAYEARRIAEQLPAG